MSFTDADKESIRHYLGYSIDAQVIANITTRCLAVEAVSAQAVATIQSDLRSLERTDQQIRNALPFAGQTFSSNAGGTQQFVPGATLKNLKAEAKQLIANISTSMSLPIARDIYVPMSGPSQSIRA